MWGILRSRVQDGYSVTSECTPLLSSLVGLASPWTSTPYWPDGPLSWGDSSDVSTANRTTLSIVSSFWLLPINLGMYIVSCDCGECKYVCVICACVYVCVYNLCACVLCACVCGVQVFLRVICLPWYIANHQGHHRGIPCYLGPPQPLTLHILSLPDEHLICASLILHTHTCHMVSP